MGWALAAWPSVAAHQCSTHQARQRWCRWQRGSRIGGEAWWRWCLAVGSCQVLSSEQLKVKCWLTGCAGRGGVAEEAGSSVFNAARWKAARIGGPHTWCLAPTEWPGTFPPLSASSCLDFVVGRTQTRMVGWMEVVQYRLTGGLAARVNHPPNRGSHPPRPLRVLLMQNVLGGCHQHRSSVREMDGAAVGVGV